MTKAVYCYNIIINFRNIYTLPWQLLVLLFGIQVLVVGCKGDKTPEQTQPTITHEMFFQQVATQEDIILDAGDLGQYSISGKFGSDDVPKHIIRQELIDLLNKLQAQVKQPVHISVGYRSPQYHIYQWAKWLSENTDQIQILNDAKHGTWDEWVLASQDLDGCPRLSSKHQSGEAADVRWDKLSLNSDALREQNTKLILESGGTKEYTPEERVKYNIAEDDNFLFAVKTYAKDESSSGQAYCKITYQPSDSPAIPNTESIGTRLDSEPPSTPPEEKPPPPSDKDPPPIVSETLYKKGDILLITDGEHGYFAEVTADANKDASDVSVKFYNDETDKKLGVKVPVKDVRTKREEPKDGWGNVEVFIQYFDGTEWKFSADVLMFEDHYLLPASVVTERKMPLSKVRVAFFKPN